MPRWKKAPTEHANDGPAPTAGPSPNKMQCVRDALGELGQDAAPTVIQGFLRSRFGLDMNTKMISTYKGDILRRGRAPAKPATTAARAEGPATGTITVEDIRAVKELAERIGAGKVRALVDVLYPQG